MKIVFISGMLPSGHYSQYLTSGIVLYKETDLIVYSDKDPKNLSIKGCGKIKPVWSKSIKYIYQIIREVLKDKPDVVHFQHEINMFGSLSTALFFPFLILAVRVLGYKTVTTIHGVVGRNQVDENFINLFMEKSFLAKSFFVKMFFNFIFRLIPLFSNSIIVHTNLLKNVLVDDYGAAEKKINVIPTAIPQKEIKEVLVENYFFYFGYMVRRKGLDYALEGFRKFIEKNPDSDYKLVLAGGVIKGQEKALEEIKSNIKDNNLEDKVFIKGFIEEKEQDDLYGKAKAVIIPAKISIAASGPLYHSVSYGKCVIASKVGNLSEEIKHLETGILTDNNKWDEAFDFVVKNEEVVKKIEINNQRKARIRTPFATAGKCVELYKAVI